MCKMDKPILPSGASREVCEKWAALQAANRAVHDANAQAVAAAEAFGIAWAKWDAETKAAAKS